MKLAHISERNDKVRIRWKYMNFTTEKMEWWKNGESALQSVKYKKMRELALRPIVIYEPTYPCKM